VRACLRPGPEGWRRSRQRAPLTAAPSPAEFLIAARDDRLGRVLEDAQLAEELGGERVGNGEHAEQDALGPERLPRRRGRARGERRPRGWGNAEAAAAGVLERARPELLLEALAHRLEVDPSVASASGSILGRPAATHGQSASSTASALTPSCRRTAVAPAFRSRISTNNRCSVPT
jgi:hypothetical protein